MIQIHIEDNGMSKGSHEKLILALYEPSSEFDKQMLGPASCARASNEPKLPAGVRIDGALACEGKWVNTNGTTSRKDMATIGSGSS